MKNNEKIKKIYNQELSLLNENICVPNLNNSFQFGNNKLKMKYSIKEKLFLKNFKKSILSKITQLQLNQQKTNLKLSSLINILLSKLIGNQKYTIFHSYFSIIKLNKKEENNNNKNEIQKFIESHMAKESKMNDMEKENENNQNNNIRKIGTISLETELEIRRYTLSNQKTKSKEKYFKNKENTDEKINYKGKNDNNFYNNLFKITNNDNNNIIKNERNNYYYNSLNNNDTSENIRSSKNIFGSSSYKNRKPIAFNEVNQSNTNKNYYSGGINEENKIVFSENNDNRRIYINALNIHNNSSHNINNKSNILDNKSTKGPVKIKLNRTEKPVLLINHNENNSDKNNNSNRSKDILDLSDNSTDKKLSLQIEDSINSKNKNFTINENINNDDIKIRRKYSESNSESDINFSQLNKIRQKNVYSRKIRGFNFRNNIKYNKEQNSEDEFAKRKGRSVRYHHNGRGFSQIT
jgi:hypothetical protein